MSFQAEARDFLDAVRGGAEAPPFVARLAGVRLEELAAALPTDAERSVFWIHAYNGFTQLLMRRVRPEERRSVRFFLRRQIGLAGARVSLDFLESALLRASRPTWGLGYVVKPWPGRLERTLRVTTLDPRVHFALNCGAQSCPPIRFYQPATLDADLERATRSYLEAEVRRADDGRSLLVPSIFRLYRGDFGGRAGILRFLSARGFAAPDGARLRFTPWDWTSRLAHVAP